ncbi:MAG: type II secretion system minor pseudopilin GspK [Firmicutes bacterium]|nr:type II secretion system minor pseudopilin GspK [Bacillota bacterium]
MRPHVANRQRGVALITVLLVVAIVAVIAVSMSGRLKGQVDRAQAMEMSENAYWYWLSAEALVRQVLTTELENDGYANRDQNWATQQGPFPVDNGLIGGRVRDLHACFNLNALYPGTEETPVATAGLALEQYQALLTALEFDDFTSQQLSATLLDWLDDDTVLINSYGAEDADYESLPRPYQAANSMMSHVSELRQVVGYTQEVFERLRPHVCVIPQRSDLALNINTMAPERPELLSAMFLGELSVDQARDMLTSWPQGGYDSVDEILALAELQGLVPEGDEQARGAESLTVESEFFELRAAVQFGNAEFFAVSIVQARGDETRVLHRSRRGYDWND